MLKSLLLSLSMLLTSIPVFADPGLASNPSEVAKVAADKCTTGCLILSPADVAELEAQVNAFAQRAFMAGGEAGYAKGVEDLAAAAKKNPKICPKNI